MKPYLLTCLFIIWGLAATQKALAQAKAIHAISGTVIDSAGNVPLSFVTVNLKTGEQALIKTTVTKTNGTFNFQGLTPADYMITIVSVGYRSKSIMMHIADSTKILTDLCAIYLSTQINGLKEVSITADRPIIKQKADRIIYDLQADPESKGSSVLGMMHKIPFISVDADDNILLKGNSGYKVLINGKPSPMLQNNLKAILRSMPAATIKSIEVITIPPSKYDAEGFAGIINIITNKKLNNGYSGTLNVNEAFPSGGPGTGGSFTLKEGNFGISAYGGGNSYNAPGTSNSNSRVTTGADPTSLAQEGDSKSNSKTGYFGAELSYEIDSLNLVSGQFNLYGNKASGTNNQTSLLTGAAGILRGYELDNTNNNNGSGLDAAINYQLGFKKDKNRLLTFSYEHSDYNHNLNNHIDILNPVNFAVPGYSQANKEVSKEQSAQVDYVYPVKNLNIEIGVKGIFRSSNSKQQYRSLNNGQFELDPAFSNQFNYTQDVYSAYNSYELNLKSWNFHGGLRIERTITNADFISAASVQKQNYFNVVPAISLNKTFKDNSSFNFGFTQRISRPSINRLDPFVDLSNPDIQLTGNPNLKPVHINDLQLGYNISKKASVNFSVDYAFAKHLVLQVSTFDPSTNITTITYANTGTTRGLMGFFNINYPLTKKLNISMNSNLGYFWIEGEVNNTMIHNNLLKGFLSLSTGYSFDDGWRLNGNLNMVSRDPTGLQGTSSGIISTSFGVNKSIIKNKLSFSASANNPLTKFRNNNIETHGPDFTQVSNTQTYFRSFRFSLDYNFGALKDGIKKSRKRIRNDDVSK